MEQAHQILLDQTHDSPQTINPSSSTHFQDFSYPFHDIPGASIDAGMEQSSEPYNVSAHGSISDHRGSNASPTGMQTAFSNAQNLIQQHNGSLDGSDQASPESSRMGGGEMFGDDFGMNNGGAGDGSDLGAKTKVVKNDLTPSWTELKTKAGKERKRLPLACIACRRKKIRCSGEKPACKHCLRSRIPCVYKVTTRKAAPRTDYMAMLDKRLKRMEERIIKIVPKEEQEQTSFTRAQVKPAIPGTTPARPPPGKKRTAEDAFGSELDAWAKTSSKSHTDGKPGSLVAQEAEESRLLTEGAEALPSQDIQEHLAEVFFENLYGQAYHLLHKPSFMRKLKAGQVPPVLILAVCAVSARFSTHPKLNTSPPFLRGEPWAAEARSIVMKRYDWPNITILTCLLILGLHEFGTCYGGRSWALGGMAIRMAYALQLHRDLDHDPYKPKGAAQLSFIDREIRRRTMWACFLMDRFNSSGTDRPMFMKEQTISVQLPIREKFFQLDMEGPTEDMKGLVPHPVGDDAGQLSDAKDNMGVAAYIIRSIALWGRIIIYHFQGGKELDPHQVWDPDSGFYNLAKQTEDFSGALPDDLQYFQDNLTTHDTEGLANQFLFLHITIQQNILFLNYIAVHGHPGGRPPMDAPREFVTKSSAKAFEAAKRISEVLRDAESYSVTAPFAGYCAFLSSTVQMPAVFSKHPITESLAKKNLATNVRYLTKMKRYWGAFHFTSEHLKEQFRSTADAAKQGLGAAAGSNAAASSIFQYGDWFDRYPHGVSQSDFEDTATPSIKKEKGDDAVLEQKSDYHTVEEFFHTHPPIHTQSGEITKPNPKRKAQRKQSMSQSSSQQDTPPQQPPLSNMPQSQMQIPNNQLPYTQLSPTSMYTQPAYFNQDILFPPNPQGMLPQLDRHLVFGAYANMDPSLENMNGLWDMGVGNGSVSGTGAGWASEPTSAWFMPFNMEPPDVGQEDIFGTLGGVGLGDGVGSLSAAGFGLDIGMGSVGLDGMHVGNNQGTGENLDNLNNSSGNGTNG